MTRGKAGKKPRKGHEMGHGQKDHPAKGARRSLNMSILGAATGTDLGVIVANVINNRNITKPMEREADALAFERSEEHTSELQSGCLCRGLAARHG